MFKLGLNQRRFVQASRVHVRPSCTHMTREKFLPRHMVHFAFNFYYLVNMSCALNRALPKFDWKPTWFVTSRRDSFPPCSVQVRLRSYMTLGSVDGNLNCLWEHIKCRRMKGNFWWTVFELVRGVGCENKRDGSPFLRVNPAASVLTLSHVRYPVK